MPEALGLLVVLFALASPVSAQGAERDAESVQAAPVSGITTVTHGGPALTKPSGEKQAQVLMYGLGLVFQVAPRTAAISCNIRTVGSGHWDFENGSDFLVFDETASISQQKRIEVARNEEDTNPLTGRQRVAVTYPIQVGFVPLGAQREDGVVFPHSGTGFGFSEALCFDLNDQGYYTPAEVQEGGQVPSSKRWYLHQFAYDGQTFRVVKRDLKSGDAPLKTADGTWAILAPGMSVAIADQDDLLLPVMASDGKRDVSGVSRWSCIQGDWRPVKFSAVSEGMEPSLIREIDGTLLYSVRGVGAEGQAVRVWRSADAGENWSEVWHAPTLRSNAPVVLNQGADGTPYIAACQPGTLRATLSLWPLNPERSGCDPLIIARDSVGDFGPAPQGTTWFADHPSATTVQLGDGRWHHLLGYRVMAYNLTGVGGETITPQTGCYIEEVFSTGKPRPVWRF